MFESMRVWRDEDEEELKLRTKMKLKIGSKSGAVREGKDDELTDFRKIRFIEVIELGCIGGN